MMTYDTAADIKTSEAILESSAAEYRFEAKSFATPAFEYAMPYESTVIPLKGGTEFLYLLKPVRLKISHGPETTLIVEDWDIALRLNPSAGQGGVIRALERELVRRFELLARKAAAGALDERDEAIWQKLSDYVDYQRYSEQSAVPTYAEAVVEKKINKTLRLVLHDGSSVTVSANAAAQFDDFDSGERVSGYFRLDRNHQVLDAYGVSFAVAPAGDREARFKNWVEEKGLGAKFA